MNVSTARPVTNGMPGTPLHGPLPAATVHLCIDMQDLFAPGAPWAAPWFERVLPRVEMLARARATRTVFTRFIPPRRAEEMPGTWATLYRRWPQVTLEQLDPRRLELTPALAALVPPAHIVDKTRYSAFHGTGLRDWLVERKVEALVLSGTETDVCVLGSVLDAVDLGFRVVVASDAICSSSDSAHDAALKLYHERFSCQVEVAEVEEILEAWC